MSLNKGAALPADPQGRWYKVISPSGADKIRGVLLADTFHGCWVHWDSCVVPCYRTEKCTRCRQGKSSRWQGYIAFYDMVQKDRFVLSLTEMAARACLDLLAEFGTLRGCQIETFRSVQRKNNARQVVKLIKFLDGDAVPSEHPILDSLNRLWGMNLARLQGDVSRERPFSPKDDNDGVPLPPARTVDQDYTPPTPEQRERLKRVLGDIGGMPE